MRINSNTGQLDTSYSPLTGSGTSYVTNIDSYIYIYGNQLYSKKNSGGFAVVDLDLGDKISQDFTHIRSNYDSQASIWQGRNITNGIAFVQNTIHNNLIRVFDTRYNVMRN